VDSRFIGPLAVLIAALLLVALERRLPYRAGQRLFRAGFWSDLLLYGLVQSYVLGWVINHVVDAIDRATGWSRLALVGGWPLGAQLAFFVVTHDLYIYGFHRLQHRVPLLWRIHEAHHSGRDVDWLSGARSHALEILVNQTIEFAPIVLLGAHPSVVTAKLAIDSVWGMYIHSNVDARPGWWSRILTGPELHRWHHATDPVDVNFATKLAIWDWLFGTAHLPVGRKPEGYGLTGVSDFPRGYFRQQAAAFRRCPEA
jgi:sterol desaturase/sphingolipid hydroxylase (fatty acid hydroxylase superfamily)